MHCRMFNSVPLFDSLDVSCTPVVKTNSVSRYCPKSSRVDKHRSRLMLQMWPRNMSLMWGWALLCGIIPVGLRGSEPCARSSVSILKHQQEVKLYDAVTQRHNKEGRETRTSYLPLGQVSHICPWDWHTVESNGKKVTIVIFL